MGKKERTATEKEREKEKHTGREKYRSGTLTRTTKHHTRRNRTTAANTYEKKACAD